jgi:Ala-tRNA(Pro) deacylase
MATAPSTERGVALVSQFLREAGIDHDVVEHQPTYSAVQEAHAAREEPRHTAKTLLLHDRDGWRLAVIPANRRLDMAKARRLLGGTTHLRLASEEEMRQVFPAFDVGALPPVGPQLPLPEAVDVRLLYRDRLLCSTRVTCCASRSRASATCASASPRRTARTSPSSRACSPLPRAARYSPGRAKWTARCTNSS